MAKVYFYYAAMNAGKSTTLLQSSFNYRERGMNTMLFAAKIDDRYQEGTITSRLGIQAAASVFDSETNIFARVQAAHAKEPLHCVLVDEAQFLTHRQVKQVMAVADSLSIPVLCYGLRTDFQAQLFEGSQWLLALADELVELKTICECGKKAIMNMRIDGEGRAVTEGESIEIGGNDRYIAVCRKHFMQRTGQDNTH